MIDPQAMRGSTMMHDPIYDVQTTKRGAAEKPIGGEKKGWEGVEKNGVGDSNPNKMTCSY